jgi:hypothetical protein
MAKRKPAAPESALPVDPERLRRQFPALTAADVAAYVDVTRFILAAAGPSERAQRTRQVMADARNARQRSAEETLSSAESRALKYLTALEKMQGRTS